MPPVDKLNVWEDARVQKRSAHLNGRTYGFLYGEPRRGKYRATVFLIHGFPDISMGWRYQIPMLLKLGVRVVALDCMGYGRTDAPPYLLKDYGFKRISDDVALLAKQLGAERIILGGHDWGGAIVYRIALYYPTLVSHLFSICTPYFPPNPSYTPLLIITRSAVPNLSYQHQLASGTVEVSIQSPAEIRSFLNVIYGGRPGPATTGSDPAFVPEVGFRLTGLETFNKTRLLSDAELDYYAAEFSRSGIHGPLNWYRTREINWEAEFEHFFHFGTVAKPPPLEQDVLFVLATKDGALKPELARRMVDQNGSAGKEEGEARGVLPRLRRREVEADHWVLWEKPDEVNSHIREWMEEVVFKGQDATEGMVIEGEASQESKL